MIEKEERDPDHLCESNLAVRLANTDDLTIKETKRRE